MTDEIVPVPCIIDTDPGVDDVIAILLALASPHLVVAAITLTHGNTTLAATVANLEKLFYALERHLDAKPEERERWKGVVDGEWRKKHGATEKILVYRGSEGPIEGKAVTAKYFHGRDGLADCTTRHPDLTPPASHVSPFYTLVDSSAVSGTSSLLSRYPPRTVAYVALGPLTTLAQLHLSSPSATRADSLLRRFRTIVSMGGAINHAGNVTSVAEFNYYADPFAAQTLFALSLPELYIFPLDITTYLTLPFSRYASAVDPALADTESPSVADGKDPLVHFTSSFFERTKEVMRSFGADAMELHDPTVTYALLDWARAGGAGERPDPDEADETECGSFAPGWDWEKVEFEVETHGLLTRGMLVQDLRAASKSSTSLTARTGLTNRTQAIEALDVEEVEAKHVEEAEAAQETAKRRKLDTGGDKEERKRVTSGARVVVSSPGSEAMRNELLQRVWGVDRGTV
ncbi:hypothetical protein JCM1841_004026 [Sporobolomyces salmonicolor]